MIPRQLAAALDGRCANRGERAMCKAVSEELYRSPQSILLILLGVWLASCCPQGQMSRYIEGEETDTLRIVCRDWYSLPPRLQSVSDLVRDANDRSLWSRKIADQSIMREFDSVMRITHFIEVTDADTSVVDVRTVCIRSTSFGRVDTIAFGLSRPPLLIFNGRVYKYNPEIFRVIIGQTEDEYREEAYNAIRTLFGGRR